MIKRVLAVVVAAGIAGGGYYAWSGGHLDGLLGKKPAETATARGRGRGQGPVPVTVARAESRSVPVTIETIGQMQPYATVSVKSRVDGQVMEVFFRDGQTVTKGDPLFRIDPRSFQAKVNEAEANMARDRAQLSNARSDLGRYTQLSKSGYSSQQKFDQARATVEALEAALKANAATLERARLDLGYTRIDAPIEGRVGSVLVDPGNLVKANDGLTLVVINQLKPIYVSFAVPEQHLGEIKARMKAGPVEVEIYAPGKATDRVRGKVVFINNAVDATTGTIQIKAAIANEDEKLISGQFVRVSLVLHEIPEAVVVPLPAVQSGQNGSFVYVVDDQKRATLRDVTVGPEAGSVVVIEKGLAAGETVVTEGQMRLRPNARVATQDDRATPAVAGGRRGKDGAGAKGEKRRKRERPQS